MPGLGERPIALKVHRNDPIAVRLTGSLTALTLTAGLLTTTVLYGRQPFSPALLFTAGEVGAWYDPSDFLQAWRLNLVTYSEQFDNAAWAKTSITVTANAITAPNGTTTAEKLTASVSASGQKYITYADFNIGPCVRSVYMKAAEYTRGTISAFYPSSNYASAVYDLAGGTVASVSSGDSATITAVGNGWYLCTLTTTRTSTTSFGGFQIRPNTGGNAIESFVGDGVSGIYAWGADIRTVANAAVLPLYQPITDGVTDYLSYRAFPVMYQDAAGTTPVTAYEQPVGLVLDKSKAMALGAELVTNGTFPTDLSGWTATGTTPPTWVAGAARIQATSDLRQTLTTVAGVTYRITLNAAGAGLTASSINVGIAAGGNTLLNVTMPASGMAIFRATSTTSFFRILGGTGADFTVDNVSVVAISGNHAYQTTTTARPVLSARYNLLTFSEQFDNAIWAKVGATVTANATTAPDGNPTADTLKEDATLTQRYAGYTVSPGAGPLVYSIYAKIAAGTRFLQIRPIGVGTGKAWANFNLTTGTVDSSGGTELVSTSITAAANGFYRCQMVANHAATPTGVQFSISNASTENPVYTGDNTSGLYLWGADLRTSGDGVGVPSYQWVIASTFYDTVGFPPYLKFDGTDDGLITQSIDFSALDRMTVFAAVRKMSDATQAMLLELSTSVGSFNGTFNVQAPRTAGGTPGRFSFVTKGSASATVDADNAAFASPDSALITAQMDIANDLSLIRVNGAQQAISATDLGTGTMANQPLYIARRGGSSLPFNGRLYQLVVRGENTAASLITATETWINGKAKIF